MPATLRKIRFILAWQTYRVGDEITPNGTLRDWLIANGYAKVIGGAGDRPANLSARAAAKLAQAGKDLLSVKADPAPTEKATQ